MVVAEMGLVHLLFCVNARDLWITAQVNCCNELALPQDVNADHSACPSLCHTIRWLKGSELLFI
jgi:hypothetical protein